MNAAIASARSAALGTAVVTCRSDRVRGSKHPQPAPASMILKTGMTTWLILGIMMVTFLVDRSIVRIQTFSSLNPKPKTSLYLTRRVSPRSNAAVHAKKQLLTRWQCKGAFQASSLYLWHIRKKMSAPRCAEAKRAQTHPDPNRPKPTQTRPNPAETLTPYLDRRQAPR